MADYFVNDARFPDEMFHARFRMSKRLVLKIVNDVEARYDWLKETVDGRMRKSFTPLQKVTSAIKQLMTGNTPDENNEYLCMSTRTSRECLQFFLHCRGWFIRQRILVSSNKPRPCAYLRSTRTNTSHSGDVGYCTHLTWRMCHRELREQYKRVDHEHPTVMVEAVASQDLWFWHVYCGAPGSNNDIDVVEQSPIWIPHRNGTAPDSSFSVSGHQYSRGYYLTDRAYPSWSTDPNEKKFKKLQEGVRKDIERDFGVLKGKWGILRRPMRAMTVDKIRNVVDTCMILHNMIIKDDGYAISPVHIRDQPVEPADNENFYGELLDANTHFRLRFDLVNHIANQDLPHLNDLDEN